MFHSILQPEPRPRGIVSSVQDYLFCFDPQNVGAEMMRRRLNSWIGDVEHSVNCLLEGQRYVV